MFAKISLLLLVRNDVINELPANCNGCKINYPLFKRAFDTMLLLNANLAPHNLFLAHLIEYQAMFLFSSAERGINLLKQIGRDLSRRWVLLSDLITIHLTKSPLFLINCTMLTKHFLIACGHTSYLSILGRY